MRRSRSDAVRAFYIEVGQKISKTRRHSRLTQEALAQQVSLTRSSIVNIERGKQQLLVHTLMQIAHALQVEAESLVPDTVPMEQPLKETISRFVSDPSGRAWIRDRLKKLEAKREKISELADGD